MHGLRARWLASLVLIAGAGCDPFHTEFDTIEAAQTYRSRERSAAPRKEELVVMTYNVKFGGGRIDFFFDCHGDRVLMSKHEVHRNLDALAEKINQVDPDVLFLQEVDTASKRAAFVDQMQVLLDATDLNFGVYASHWRADFVPSDGLGAVDSGNAILSKYALHDPLRIALNLRSDQDAIERYFYIKRNLLTARLDDGALGEPVMLVATHTEAYSKDGTKRTQIDRFTEELDAHAQHGVVLGGGDLNTLPPGSRKTTGFADSVCEGEFEADDFSAEGDWLAELYERYDEAIDLDAYQRDNTPYFTHTTDKDGFWNRKLDYLFTNGDLSDGLVHQDESSGGMATMPLSDHAPVSATFRLQPASPATGTSNEAGDAGK